jgi:hypothetical protein
MTEFMPDAPPVTMTVRSCISFIRFTLQSIEPMLSAVRRGDNGVAPPMCL